MTSPQALMPHLAIDGAADAIDFYKAAFGATETLRMPAQDGRRLMHAEIDILGTRVLLHDHFPEYAAQHVGGARPPKVLGGTAVTLHLEVPDCDVAIAKAQAAGATVTMPPFDAFWGARYGQIMDPFGHVWSFAHPLPGQPG
jgi:PhnB protein